MTWQAAFHSAALIAAVLLTIPLAAHGWNRRSLPGSFAFSMMMISGAAWALLYLIETTTADLILKQRLVPIRFYCTILVPYLWTAFCLLYVKPPAIVRRGLLVLASLQTLTTAVFIATNDQHLAMWRQLFFVEQPWGSVYVLDRGPAFWQFVAATYLALPVATGLLIWRMVRSRAPRWQVLAVLLAVVIPAAGNLASLLIAPAGSGIDLSPMLFPVSGLAFAVSLFRFKLLDLVPIPRDRRIENLRDGVIMLNARYRPVELNQAAWDLLKSDLSGGATLEEESSPWRSVIDQLRTTGEVETEVTLNQEGGTVFLDVRGSTMRNAVGTMTGSIIVLRDVTERREAENALASLNSELEQRVTERTADLETANQRLQAELERRREAEEQLRRLSANLEQQVVERSAALAAANAATWRSEARFNDLVQNAKDIIFSSAITGELLAINGAVETLLGYRPDDLVGSSLVATLSKEDAEIASRMTARKLAGERVTVYEANLRTKDGRLIPFEFSSWLRYRNGEPVEVQGIARDVSERHALQAQLQQAQRLEAVGRLAGGIAHDFNNLLTAINGFSQLLVDSIDPDSESAQFAREIKKAGYQAAVLTARLLAYGRRTMLQPEIVDLNEIVRDLTPMLGRLLGEDLDLRFDLDPALESTKADRTQLQQVIVNLAVNARDAMPAGGVLEFRTQNREVDAAASVLLDQLPPGPYATLTVRDTGTGIDPTILDHIFEPFFTTKEVGKGSGLGLATVYGIIKQSGGHVTVDSKAGLGSTFTVYLRAETSPGVAPVEPAAAEPLPSRSATILFVEDEPVVRSLVREIFRNAGLQAIVAEGPGDALERVGEITGTLDLLVTDVIMPEMNGHDLASRLSQRWPELSVLYISGYAEDVIMHEGVLEPGCEFLAKPFSPSALITAVQRLLAARNDGPKRQH